MLKKIESLTQKIERKKISFQILFLSVFSIAFIRNFFEKLFKNENIYFADDYITTLITYFFHFNFFWYSVFFGLVILLFFFTKKVTKIKSILNIALFAFPIILFPPFFDFIINNKDLMLYPNNPADFIYDSLNFFSFNKKLYGITLGMRIEILIVCMFFGLYVYIKTKKIIRSFISIIISYLFIVFHGIWLSFFAQIYEFGFNFTNNFNLAECKLFTSGYVLRDSQNKISVIYIFSTSFFLALILYFKNLKIFKALFSQLRITRIFHYLLLLVFGILIGKRIVLIQFFHDTSFLNFYHISNPFEIIGILASIFSLSFSFYSAVIFNDIGDLKIDKINEPQRPLSKQIINIRQYKNIGLLLLILSLSFAYCINISFFLIIILINIFAYLYSIEPFRLKKYFLISNFSLGFIALFTFFLGTSVYLEHIFFKFIPIKISIIIFFTISSISQIKDIKDYIGDKQNGIKNILTLTSFKTGQYIIGFQILFFAFFIPLFFNFNNLLLLSILLSILMLYFLVFNKFSEKILFSVYFIFICIFFLDILNSNILY